MCKEKQAQVDLNLLNQFLAQVPEDDENSRSNNTEVNGGGSGNGDDDSVSGFPRIFLSIDLTKNNHTNNELDIDNTIAYCCFENFCNNQIHEIPLEDQPHHYGPYMISMVAIIVFVSLIGVGLTTYGIFYTFCCRADQNSSSRSQSLLANRGSSISRFLSMARRN